MISYWKFKIEPKSIRNVRNLGQEKHKMSQHWVETLQGNNYSIRYMFFCIWLWGVALPASRIPDQHLALQIGSERRGHSLVHPGVFFYHFKSTVFQLSTGTCITG